MDGAFVIGIIGVFVGIISGTLIMVEMIRHLGNNHNGQPKT